MLLPLVGRLSTSEPTPSATETVRVENEPMAAAGGSDGAGRGAAFRRTSETVARVLQTLPSKQESAGRRSQRC